MLTRIFIVLAFCAAGAFAETNVVEQLAKIPHFAFGGTGIAGTTSEGEILFNEIRAQPNASTNFLHILENGNPQGQCYALAGLHGVNMDERANAFLSSNTPVQCISGCMMFTDKMGAVASNILSGEFDFFLKEQPPQ